MDIEHYKEILLGLDEKSIVLILAILNFVIGTIVYVTLFYLDAWYGRYNTSSSFTISPKLGWFIQEFPAFAIPTASLVLTHMGVIGPKYNWWQTAVLMCFIVHYFQRSCIYPFLMKGGSPLPIFLMFLAFLFCSVNGYMQARSAVLFSVYPNTTMTTARLIVGIALFCWGLIINIQSDHILRNLRKPGEKGYKIPRGGFFEYVSCANYCGEIIEWIGFAVASWSIPSAAFAFFTVANLVPRAVSHHQWYLQKFEDYPPNRKAVIPFLM